MGHSSFCQTLENQFTHYTTKDGLPDGAVIDIKQDKQGFLWLASPNGLCRFDGHTFKTFRYSSGDTASLRDNHINSIFIDSQSRIWCASYNWLYLYHPDGSWFEHFSMYGYNAQKICGEENGRLIIACSMKGLYKFDITKKTFSQFNHKGIDPAGYFDYVKDEDGIEWMSIKNNTLRYDPKTEKQNPIFPTTSTLALMPNGFLVVGTFDQGLLLVNRKTNSVKRFVPDKNDPNSILHMSVTCLYSLNDSIILVGTNIGISIFNIKKETFTNITPVKTNPGSLSEANTRIASIFCDREGILWIGGKHLDKHDFKNFNIRIIPSYGQEHNQKRFDLPFGLFLTSGGKFLLGSYGGMNIYDPVTDKLQKIENKEFNPGKNEKYKTIDCIQSDEHGNIWCINWPHFCSFKTNDNRVTDIHEYTFPFGFRLGDMKLDQKGRVLIGTIGRGLIRFDPADSSYMVYDTSSSSPIRLSNPNVRSIFVANDGSTWLGTLKGINKIEKDGITVKQYSQNKNRHGTATDWIVNGINEDSRGIIWFTTLEHGIGRIDPATDSVTMLSVEQGLPTCLYETICIDDNNNLWAVSRMGVLRINTLTLQNQLYTENEGFPLPDDVTDIHYSKFSRKLYILTDYAIYEVNTIHTNYSPRIPETLITGFSVFDKEKPLPLTNTINLKYSENFINIQFAALLFHSNDQIKYAYKMGGIDDDWVYCNFKRNASYTNLPPGHYIFQVRSQSPEGAWSNIPTSLSIIITPPFWQTWWFYILEAIVAIAFTLWIIRLYTTKKLAKQKIEIETLLAVSKERTRIASDMHDDLGAGLTSIRLLSEIANQKTDKNSAAKTEIEKIAKSAGNLSENLREIIWAINTRNDVLDDFIIFIRTYAVEYFDNTPIRFQFNRPVTIPDLAIPGELRRNIFLCIKESLHNIIKHSQATEATLTFEVIGHILVTTIKDNGIGFDLNQVNKFGNGLNTMKERLKKFGSTLEIEVNNGTKLVYKINIIAP